MLCSGYDRTVLAYHGCDATVAESLLAGEAFRPSRNDYDWLGEGIYFWEYGADRALRFAQDQHARGRVAVPTIVGAFLQLGTCFDLMDTRFTADLAAAYPLWRKALLAKGWQLPRNAGAAPDHKLRRRDCAVLNCYLNRAAHHGVVYDTVRCGFVEGRRIYPGSGIRHESHVQIAVRDPDCILGVFRPKQ